jgi:hypothetical protein
MKFLCDQMLGTLARWLRFLGCDTGYPEALDDNDVKALAAKEGRTLLTRDKELSSRVPGAHFVESDDPDEQLVQVARAFRLTAEDALSRCSVCNDPIDPVPKEAAKEHVPQGVYDRQSEFWRCRQCGRFYWKGSHFEHVLAKVREVAAKANT